MEILELIPADTS